MKTINFKSVLKLLAYIFILVAFFMLIPTGIAVYRGETESLKAFLITLGSMALVCLLILLHPGIKHEEIKIGVKESYLFVTLVWVCISFFGALPLYICRSYPTFAGCYFEIMSGFTTTGATALDNIEECSKSILFWRNITNWIGGMGIVVLFVAVLPAFGAKGTALYGAESVGPTKDKLTPKIRHTALALWLIYFALSVLQTILLLLGGLDLFNALTVTFGTMGAAGYSPTNYSIQSYNSSYVEWVCTIFMFLAGANFALYFKLIKGQFKKVARDGETRVYFGIVLVASLSIALNLIIKSGVNIIEAVRLGFFHVISYITTTGFYSTNINRWPVFSQLILFLVSFVGGCAGSAGGGVKVIRIAAIFKVGTTSIKKRLHQNAVTAIKIGDDTLSDGVVSSICGFIGLYFITFFVGSVIVSLSGQDALTCISSTILTLGNIGLGIGGIGIDFSFSVYPDWTLYVFSFLMLVGRLELFTVYSLFTRDFWRN